jgi:hypothetical protein
LWFLGNAEITIDQNSLRLMCKPIMNIYSKSTSTTGGASKELLVSATIQKILI